MELQSTRQQDEVFGKFGGGAVRYADHKPAYEGRDRREQGADRCDTLRRKQRRIEVSQVVAVLHVDGKLLRIRARYEHLDQAGLTKARELVGREKIVVKIEGA